jgi:hypothetical protein
MIDAFDDRFYLVEQPLPGLGQRDAARGAVEKPDAEPIADSDLFRPGIPT